MNIFSLLGNGQKLDGGAMFGHVPSVVWKQWVEPDEWGRIPLACRSFFLELEGVKILLEAGIGAFFDPKMSERFGVQNPTEHCLLKTLSEKKMTPRDIDLVILSHLHFDHSGGIFNSHVSQMSEGLQLIFPQAEIWVSEEAWARALNPHERDRASFIPQAIEKLKQHPFLKILPMSSSSSFSLPETLDSLVFESELRDQLKEHLFFVQTEGHTPGHLHTLIRHKGQGSWIFCGDLIPGRHWIHLPVTMGYDRYPEKVINEKKSLLEQATLQNWTLLFTHDEQFGFCKVKEKTSGRYEAYDFQVE